MLLQQRFLVFFGNPLTIGFRQDQVAPFDVAGLEHAADGRVRDTKHVEDVLLGVAVQRIGCSDGQDSWSVVHEQPVCQERPELRYSGPT